MGGNSAWRKRVARGELAKGSGGAALRHRPRLGRRGEDLKLNRKGNIGGRGNPKKIKKVASDTLSAKANDPPWYHGREWSIWMQILAMVVCLYLVIGAFIKLISITKKA
jgi:hypothetical protein